MIKDTISQWEALANNGVVVSVVCGPMAGRDAIAWSVNCLSADLDEFRIPYEARDFAHAVEIAGIECRKRGWI